MGSLEFYLIVVPIVKNVQNESESSLASITNNTIFLSAINKALVNGKSFKDKRVQPLAKIDKVSRTG